jgi:hypothetical protein
LAQPQEDNHTDRIADPESPMPTAPTPAQRAASRANGARSRGPATEAGKARAARNGTRHGLRGGPFALLPGEDPAEFARLHAAVTADWAPRDAYERRWVRELVAAMWRQDRLRGLELAALAAAAEERPPTEATMKRLLTFARYGARIDKDMTTALRTLRVLRDRPDAHTAAPPPGRTPEPDGRERPQQRNCTSEFDACTPEPEPATGGPANPARANRRERRRQQALARKAGGLRRAA